MNSLTNVRLTITPEHARVDEPLSIIVTGLPASTAVTLRASMRSETGVVWSSEAVFESDAEGAVDLGVQAPSSGSYASVDPMGLIWSMRALPQDGGTPLFAKTSLEPARIGLQALVEDEVVAAGKIVRRAVNEDVERIEVRENGLRGTLFFPAGSGPHPGVIVIGGSGGGLQEGRAALLASHGFAALALAYFAFEDLPTYLVEIPLEYFGTAVNWMLDHPKISNQGVAMIGGSRGGEGVLLLGATFSKVCAVVANVPSHVVWQGFGDPEAIAPVFAWTYGGEGIQPMTSFGSEEEIAEAYAMSPIPLTPLFMSSLQDEASVKASVIPVERIQGPVLLVSGQDDAMWPSSTMADQVVARLKAKGFSHAVEHLCYENAGHLIRPPYIPTTVSAAPHPVDGREYAFGGTPEGNAWANQDSWDKTLAFLRDAFGLA